MVGKVIIVAFVAKVHYLGLCLKNVESEILSYQGELGGRRITNCYIKN